MKTAVLTGATGFLGRNLVDVLLREGWTLTVFHRKESDLTKLVGCNVQLCEVDLFDEVATNQAMPEKIDAVFHVAGNTSHWSRETEKQWRDNVLATRNLVAAALNKSVKRFIFTSTGATNAYQNSNEAGALKIKNNYVRTKRLAELEVYKGMEKGLNAIILKPIIILGKYDFNSYSKIFQELKKNPLKFALPGKIAFCYAEDVAVAHVRAFEKGRPCEHYVLGGAYARWYDLFFECTRLLNVKAPIVVPKWLLYLVAHAQNTVSYFTGETPSLSPDLVILLGDAPDVTYPEFYKARQELDYQSRSLPEMVELSYQWLQSENRI